MTIPRPTWLFQASPDRYDIERSLQVEAREQWNCRQHAARIRQGDRVLIWISGKDAGIYAIGTILTDPVERADSVRGLSYWKRKSEGLEAWPRVEVRYDRVLLDRPLAKVFLQWDEALADLSVIAQPRGTNFKVQEAEWQAIARWLDEPTS